jgi:hypothetical protein
MRQRSYEGPEEGPDSARGKIPVTLARAGAARFWFAVILTGIGAGISAAALMSLLSEVQHLIWPSSNILGAAAKAGPWRHFLALITPELVRSTVGEFETRAPAMRSVTTLETRTSYGVCAMIVPCSNSSAKSLVAVMPRLGGAMHEALSTARNPGLVAPAHPWIASGSGGYARIAFVTSITAAIVDHYYRSKRSKHYDSIF